MAVYGIVGTVGLDRIRVECSWANPTVSETGQTNAVHTVRYMQWGREGGGRSMNKPQIQVGVQLRIYGLTLIDLTLSVKGSSASHNSTAEPTMAVPDLRRFETTHFQSSKALSKQILHQTFDKNLVILYKTSQDPTRLQDTAKVLQDCKTAKPEMILTRSLVRLWLGALIVKIEKLIFLHFDLVSLSGGYATRSQGPKDRKIFVEWLMCAVNLKSMVSIGSWVEERMELRARVVWIQHGVGCLVQFYRSTAAENKCCLMFQPSESVMRHKCLPSRTSGELEPQFNIDRLETNCRRANGGAHDDYIRDPPPN
ncbi:hypothetical protein K438DRAFT_1945593, partial [Mycena galopus ATCC 62051]